MIRCYYSDMCNKMYGKLYLALVPLIIYVGFFSHWLQTELFKVTADQDQPSKNCWDYINTRYNGRRVTF